ncbi:MAG: VanZ family protein [Prevotella sp.]|nr:VanZ family protein [Prevotella sp.]
MRKIISLARRYPFSSALIVLIWVLCLLPFFPETPLSHVKLIDKWTHIVMYIGLCVVIWGEYLWRRGKKKPNCQHLFLYGFVAPALMGGLIELVQAYCTGGHRSGEWMDWVADVAGVVVGCLIGMLLAACRAKAKRGT